MANYDLYTELQLDKDMPPYEMAEVLGERAADLRNRGYGNDSPEIDQVETARAILGDPYKRDIYEAALYGPEDDVVNIRWLHDLADSQSPGAQSGLQPGPASMPSAPAAAPTGYPSYEPREDRDGGMLSGPSADVTRENRVDDGAGSDLEATRVTAAVQEPTSGDLVAPGVSSPETDGNAGADSADSADRADRDGGDTGRPAGDVPGVVPGAPAPSASSWQQPATPGGFGGAQHAAQPGQFSQARPQRPASQLDVSNWGVGDRTRSESKVYLSILAVIVVGMIYPLIVLLTAGSNDLNANLAVMKATLFTLAHVAAWTGINEIVWGVRKIVAPNRPTEK